jgi:hypothetical protein
LICGALGCGDDEHRPACFDVPEHFREPEVLSRENRSKMSQIDVVVNDGNVALDEATLRQ